MDKKLHIDYSMHAKPHIKQNIRKMSIFEGLFKWRFIW